MKIMSKVQVGYGSGGRQKGPKGAYGGVSMGKKRLNGGFNGLPTVDYTSVSDQRWAEIFGTESLPAWKREIVENGEKLD